MCLVVNAIITGYLAIVGAVYCTYPRFIYFAGSAGLGEEILNFILERTWKLI